MNLSIDVIDSMSNIPHFIRIQEALKTAIETKRKLNIKEDQERARLDLNTKQAARANRSLSQNEPAEGYICPVCMRALSNQDELISHWQQNHSIDTFENDCVVEEGGETKHVFGGKMTPSLSTPDYIIKNENDITVIDMIKKKGRTYSECEDVVKSYVDDEDMMISASEIDGTENDDNHTDDGAATETSPLDVTTDITGSSVNEPSISSDKAENDVTG